ncbi:discoidin domain-containing protein [Spirochaetota bacterium]
MIKKLIIAVLIMVSLLLSESITVNCALEKGQLPRYNEYTQDLRGAKGPGDIRLTRELGVKTVRMFWWPEFWAPRKGVYDWEYQDHIKWDGRYKPYGNDPMIQKIYDYGGTVFLSPYVLPEWLRGYNNCIPNNWADWEEMMRTGLNHVKSKWPDIEYIETYNEPVPNHIYHGAYQDYYEHFHRFIERYNATLAPGIPKLKIVGPALSASISIQDALMILEEGILKIIKTKNLDKSLFVAASYHCFGVHATPKFIHDIVNALTAKMAEYNMARPVWITAFNRSYEGDYSFFHPMKPECEVYDQNMVFNPYKVAMHASLLAQTYYGFLTGNNDVVPFFFMHNQYNRPESSMLVPDEYDIHADGKTTPVYNVAKMYSMMKEKHIEATSDGLDANWEGVGGIATKDDNGIAVMVFNTKTSTKNISVTLNNIPANLRNTSLHYTRYLVDDTHGNYYYDINNHILPVVDDKTVNVSSAYSTSISLKSYGTTMIVLSGGNIPTQTPTPTDAVTLTPTPTDDHVTGGKITIAGAYASGTQDPNIPENSYDGDLSTRWSVFGLGEYITYDLGNKETVDHIKIAFQRGNERVSSFDIELSTDGSSFTQVLSTSSSGTTMGLEMYDIADADAQYVRIVNQGNSVNNWISITEIEIYSVQEQVTPTHTPTATQVATVTSTPLPTATPTQAGQLLISGVTAAGAGEYTAAEDLSTGKYVYTDRSYTYTVIPGAVEGCEYILTANSDKYSIGEQHLSFNLASSATVYVGYHMVAQILPTWLSGWTDTHLVLETSFGDTLKLKLFSKDYNAGSVTLGGNIQGGTDANTMYVVVAKAQGVPGPTSTPTPDVTSTPTPDVTNTPTPDVQLTVTDLSVTSGKAYEVVENGLVSDIIYYIDRTYTITSVPTVLQNATFIKTANNDRYYENTDFLSFSVNRDVTVYVGFDSIAASIPPWLNAWTDTGLVIGTSETSKDLRVFAASFPAGMVTLSGNRPGNANSMYVPVIVERVESVPMLSASLDHTVISKLSAQMENIYSDVENRIVSISLSREVFFDLNNEFDLSNVHVYVYDINGSIVKRIRADRSKYTVSWDFTDESGRVVSPGIYIYSINIKAGQNTVSRKGNIIIVN